MNDKKCELKEYFKILENKPNDYDSILGISQGIEHILEIKSILFYVANWARRVISHLLSYIG